jgi:hypothetical protein
MARKLKPTVGARLPPHLYRWLTAKVSDEETGREGDYHNLSQAVVGELTKAKFYEEHSMPVDPHQAIIGERACAPLIRTVAGRKRITRTKTAAAR